MRASLTQNLTHSGTEMRILPAGLFRTTDGRPANIAGWVMDQQIAASVIASSLTGTEILIDYEHQSLHAAFNGQPVPAAGWFSKLEWREGIGLYALNISWNEKAKAMIAAKEYRFISPTFIFNDKTGAVERILSVAITNTPALPQLTDLSSVALSSSLVPSLAMDTDPRNQRGLELLARWNADSEIESNRLVALRATTNARRSPAPVFADSGDIRDQKGYEVLRRMSEF